MSLYSIFGRTYGGDGQTFRLPDLTNAAPDDLTHTICADGIYPSRA